MDVDNINIATFNRPRNHFATILDIFPICFTICGYFKLNTNKDA